MRQDKQLSSVKLDEVVQKRRLAQALNAKEFAVLAGVSYSAARDWFRLSGFPVFRGVVFWHDFERWRDAQTGLNLLEREVPAAADETRCCRDSKAATDLPPQAARIVADFG